jgi:hypothetical protein
MQLKIHSELMSTKISVTKLPNHPQPKHYPNTVLQSEFLFLSQLSMKLSITLRLPLISIHSGQALPQNIPNDVEAMLMRYNKLSESITFLSLRAASGLDLSVNFNRKRRKLCSIRHIKRKIAEMEKRSPRQPSAVRLLFLFFAVFLCFYE